MSWAKDHKYKPNKKTNKKKTDAYSVPGVYYADINKDRKNKRHWWFW